MDDGLRALFNKPGCKHANIAQEFGTTASPPRVAVEMVLENWAWHWGRPEDRRVAGLKWVFAPDLQSFVTGVVPRGLSLLFTAMSLVGEI